MLPLSVSLSDLLLSLPLDPPFDGDGDFIGVFNGDATIFNLNEDGGDAMFDIWP